MVAYYTKPPRQQGKTRGRLHRHPLGCTEKPSSRSLYPTCFIHITCLCSPRLTMPHSPRNINVGLKIIFLTPRGKNFFIPSLTFLVLYGNVFTGRETQSDMNWIKSTIYKVQSNFIYFPILGRGSKSKVIWKGVQRDMRLARLLLKAVERLKAKKHTADYILNVICDMLKTYIGS